MPTLTRLVLVLALIAAAVYGIMLALVTYVKPVQTDITIKIPAKDLNPVPLSPPVAPVSSNDEDDTLSEEKD
ncbi:recombinase [Paenochrobactrum sp. BZR 588]|uniref:recombinase n=1 Tax=Paenochrobactrum TaxID=999488 RepID=UPI0035BBB761